MTKLTFNKSLILLAASITSLSSVASELSTPHTFVAGNKVLATEVNENFSAIETAVNDNNAKIETNSTEMSALNQRTIALESSSVKSIVTRWGSYGQVPTITMLTTGTWYGMDCITEQAHVASAGETAIITSNITAYFEEAHQNQYIAAFTANDGELELVPSNGMATVTNVANVTVHGILSLTEGVSYLFQPAVRPDFNDQILSWVQCTTLVTIIKQ